MCFGRSLGSDSVCFAIDNCLVSNIIKGLLVKKTWKGFLIYDIGLMLSLGYCDNQIISDVMFFKHTLT